MKSLYRMWTLLWRQHFPFQIWWFPSVLIMLVSFGRYWWIRTKSPKSLLSFCKLFENHFSDSTVARNPHLIFTFTNILDSWSRNQYHEKYKSLHLSPSTAWCPYHRMKYVLLFVVSSSIVNRSVLMPYWVERSALQVPRDLHSYCKLPFTGVSFPVCSDMRYHRVCIEKQPRQSVSALQWCL